MATEDPGLEASLVRRMLVAVLGVTATIGLLVSTPAEESGRKVEAVAKPSGAIVVEHKAGPQYLRAYADIVGIWTICDGLTRGVKRGMVETSPGCMLRLERELLEHAQRTIACVPELAAPGRDYQRWAFVSLSYNIGWPSACASTVARRFRARQWNAGCDAFLMWNKAGRPLRVVRGLSLRRQRERQICMTGAPGFPAATLEARMGSFR